MNRLPAREGLREEWLKVLRKNCPSLARNGQQVCSQHFERNCFQYSGVCQRRMLKSGSLPTIFPRFEVVECQKQASRKKNMVEETLRTIHETGIQIVSLAFDGPKCTLSMIHLLGANLNIDKDMRNYIQRPITKEPIFTMIDACHSLTCVRNSVAEDDKIMFDSEGNHISWSYINEIVILQNKHTELYLAHKVATEHMQWQDKKMNVRIAAQTFSKSVGDALHYLEHETNNPIFIGATGTSKFCEVINDAFDLLNSRSMFVKSPSKIGMNSSNIEAVEKKVGMIVKYIRGLNYIDGQRVADSQRKTGFVGMIIDLHSVAAIFRYYIQKQIPDDFLLTYKLSHDHLEMFFSAVRSKGGYNNNPTCSRLVMNIFEQLLIHKKFLLS